MGPREVGGRTPRLVLDADGNLCFFSSKLCQKFKCVFFQLIFDLSSTPFGAP
jgi:hypothetical protein